MRRSRDWLIEGGCSGCSPGWPGVGWRGVGGVELPCRRFGGITDGRKGKKCGENSLKGGLCSLSYRYYRDAGDVGDGVLS